MEVPSAKRWGSLFPTLTRLRSVTRIRSCPAPVALLVRSNPKPHQLVLFVLSTSCLSLELALSWLVYTDQLTMGVSIQYPISRVMGDGGGYPTAHQL